MAQRAMYQLFTDTRGQFWWRLRAANNYIVANSAEGYVNKQHALDMIRWMQQNAGSAGYEDLT